MNIVTVTMTQEAAKSVAKHAQFYNLVDTNIVRMAKNVIVSGEKINFDIFASGNFAESVANHYHETLHSCTKDKSQLQPLKEWYEENLPFVSTIINERTFDGRFEMVLQEVEEDSDIFELWATSTLINIGDETYKTQNVNITSDTIVTPSLEQITNGSSYKFVRLNHETNSFTYYHEQENHEVEVKFYNAVSRQPVI
ncbi:hypothetical protein I3271_07480 [Photobacterium leiognathi]|uniref:hypothetical protein n=1 Tax=Photobacterium leiognathi TaxID=553611 RepID=UPI001EE077A9|nr:hypothetical protein [Photobacterium leiognathi]MCG3884527.1 hypothetical protein [Photobacterium leiognathi]